jgi:hypothetical protein
MSAGSDAPISILETTRDEIAEIVASLLEDQEPLGAEFEAVWDNNVGDLYTD